MLILCHQSQKLHEAVTISDQSHKYHTNLILITEQSRGSGNTRGGIGCLGGVSIPVKCNALDTIIFYC